MAWQLIYTSAQAGLAAGRSGFCTVARHQAIRERLVGELERISAYERPRHGQPLPIIHSHRIIGLGADTYHILSCIQDAGPDYSGRTNHIAHHLVCQEQELAGAASPAVILAEFGWRNRWTERPRYFGDNEAVDLSQFRSSVSGNAWRELTGNGAHGRLLIDGAGRTCATLAYAPGQEGLVLALFSESLGRCSERAGNRQVQWQVPFTTYLQTSDAERDFTWRGCWAGSGIHQSARADGGLVLDLTNPGSLPAPPPVPVTSARATAPVAVERVADSEPLAPRQRATVRAVSVSVAVQPKSKDRFWLIMAVLVVVMTGFAAGAYWAWRNRIHISPPQKTLASETNSTPPSTHALSSNSTSTSVQPTAVTTNLAPDSRTPGIALSGTTNNNLSRPIPSVDLPVRGLDQLPQIATRFIVSGGNGWPTNAFPHGTLVESNSLKVAFHQDASLKIASTNAFVDCLVSKIDAHWFIGSKATVELYVDNGTIRNRGRDKNRHVSILFTNGSGLLVHFIDQNLLKGDGAPFSPVLLSSAVLDFSNKSQTIALKEVLKRPLDYVQLRDGTKAPVRLYAGSIIGTNSWPHTLDLFGLREQLMSLSNQVTSLEGAYSNHCVELNRQLAAPAPFGVFSNVLSAAGLNRDAISKKISDTTAKRERAQNDHEREEWNAELVGHQAELKEFDELAHFSSQAGASAGRSLWPDYLKHLQKLFGKLKLVLPPQIDQWSCSELAGIGTKVQQQNNVNKSQLAGTLQPILAEQFKNAPKLLGEPSKRLYDTAQKLKDVRRQLEVKRDELKALPDALRIADLVLEVQIQGTNWWPLITFDEGAKP